MRVPATTKLIAENFPEQKSWISPMFFVVNKFIQDVVRAINGGVQFGDNIQGIETLFDFVYVSHAVSLPSFTWNLINPPKAMTVISAFENVTSTRLFSPIMVNIAWQLGINNIVSLTDIVKLTGNPAAVSQLTVGNRYQIRVRTTP